MDSFDTDMGDRGPTAFALLTIDASEACGLYGLLVKAWPASLEKDRDRPEEAEDWLQRRGLQINGTYWHGAREEESI